MRSWPQEQEAVREGMVSTLYAKLMVVIEIVDLVDGACSTLQTINCPLLTLSASDSWTAHCVTGGTGACSTLQTINCPLLTLSASDSWTAHCVTGGTGLTLFDV
jgi:hypothetical protein